MLCFQSRVGPLAWLKPATDEEIRRAGAERRSLIVEAGTGTGKTLAYLLPVIRSGKRVIISTGTKNLQEQLFYKDIPFLQQHFDRPWHAGEKPQRRQRRAQRPVVGAAGGEGI